MTGKIYVSIRDIAPLVGYEAHNGEYKENIEDKRKMYVESTVKNQKIKGAETTSFYQNSKIISKVAPDSKDDYQHITIDEPVTMYNDKLYIVSDGFSIGFNSLFSYDKEKNNITIQTLPFLVEYYSGVLEQNYGYSDLSEDFINQKALIYGMIVASKEATGKFGVVSTNGTEVISPRYNKIEFIENSGEFIITNSSEKVGIAYSTGETKISVSYDEIKVMDHDRGYYLVKSNNKYGVVDSSETLIVHMEYDQIGVDTSNFPADNINNQYILFNTVIPVQLNKKWGFLDATGKKLTEAIYDTVGYISEDTNERVVNNALAMKGLKVIVVSKDKKYGGIYVDGREIVPVRFDGIYSITSSGTTSYYIYFNEKAYNAAEYIEIVKRQLGIDETPEVEGNVVIKDNNSNAATNEVSNEVTNNTVENTTVTNEVTNTTENNQTEQGNGEGGNVTTSQEGNTNQVDVSANPAE